MLKACLILAIVLATATLGVGELKVKSKIDQLNTNLTAAQQSESAARLAQQQAETKAATLTEEKEMLGGELADTRSQLEEKSRIAEIQRVRADEMESKWRDVTAERNEAQQKLTQWDALGVSIQAVQSMRDDLMDARKAIEAGKAERLVLLRQFNQLKYDLSKYEGPNVEVVMEGVKGSVIAVDDDWDFVVVNVGEEDGARQSGKLIVSREGELIGKVQITSLEANQSIANILPGWKQGDIQVGDTVLY